MLFSNNRRETCVLLGMKGKGGPPYLAAFRRGQENSLAEQVGNRMNGNLTQPVGQGTEKEETAT